MSNETIRMALRLQGEWYNAYLAKAGTMEGAALIGSVKLRLVEDPECLRAWQKCMTVLFEKIVTSTGLNVDHMIQEDAPPHERAGTA